MAGLKAADRAGRERSKAANNQLKKIRDDWAARHPALAAEETALRKLQKSTRTEDAARRTSDPYQDHGTAETRSRIRAAGQGAMARLYHSGGITIRQWGASMEIAAAHERIARDVTIGSGWGFDRVDVSINPERGFFESIGAVRSEVAYSAWRSSLSRPGPVLAMVVGDMGVTAAARQYSMDPRTVRALLKAALELWIRKFREARDEVDETSLADAHAAIAAA